MKYIIYAQSKFWANLNDELKNVILGEFNTEEEAKEKIKELNDELGIIAFFYTITL